jgi:hypothetical protein
MAVGPGKYDDLCTLVREKADADGVVVLVFDGNKGSGFSIQGPISLTATLARLLRSMADQIDADLDEGEDHERRDP